MSHSENNKKWYIIEGNIGSGKTTLINILKNFNNFEVIEEPVNLWLNLKGDDNKNILQEFYDDPERYAYIFQTMVFKTRLNSIDHPQDKDIRFSERSIWTDKYVFGISCIESKKMKLNVLMHLIIERILNGLNYSPNSIFV